MSKALITFIGRSNKSEDGYKKTIYEIEGEVQEASAFLGFNLQQHLNPTRLIVMGTNGSMWDHLFEGDIKLGEKFIEQRLDLVEAVDNESVTQSQLNELQPLLSEALGIDVSLQIIPFGAALEDQVKIVGLIADHITDGMEVHLDITHGYRSLPMIALLAANYLKEIRNANVSGIWYGVLDLTPGSTSPVHNIKGLLNIADWLSAMHSYKKDGDYGVFGKLVGDTGDRLNRAAFFERTSNPVKAKQELTTWNKENNYPNDPVARLFKDELTQRTQWHRSTKQYEYEMHLAWEYLDRKDYVRASIFGLEAKVSEYIYMTKGTDSREERIEALNLLKTDSIDYNILNQLRNSLAHGTRNQSKEITKLKSDERLMQGRLKEIFKSIGIMRPPKKTNEKLQ